MKKSLKSQKEQFLLLIQTLDELFPSINSFDEKIFQIKKEKNFLMELQNENSILSHQIIDLQNDKQNIQNILQNPQNDLNLKTQEIQHLQNELNQNKQIKENTTNEFDKQDHSNDMMQREIRKQNLYISKLNSSMNWFPRIFSNYFDFFSGSHLIHKKRSLLVVDSFNHFKRLADYGDIDSIILVGFLLLFGIGHKFDPKFAQTYFQIAADRKSSIGLIVHSFFLISRIDDDHSIEEITRNLESSALSDDLKGTLFSESFVLMFFLKNRILKNMGFIQI
jgi:hypothetical protein